MATSACSYCHKDFCAPTDALAVQFRDRHYDLLHGSRNLVDFVLDMKERRRELARDTAARQREFSRSSGRHMKGGR